VTRPTPVTPVDAGPAGVVDHLDTARVSVDGDLARRLAEVCDSVSDLDEDRAEAGRDWWPVAIGWAAAGAVPAPPAQVARPTDTPGIGRARPLR
jgi:hypothetical protein